MNNLYYWDKLETISGYPCSHAVAFAPGKQQAIINVLNELNKKWTKNYDWSDKRLTEELAEVELELNKKQPKINMPASIIEFSH